jgi:hypothetical protein
MLSPDFATLYREDFAGMLVQRFDWAASDPVAIAPAEIEESRDDAGCDKHPVLTFEAQKAELLNEKLRQFRPHVGQNKHFFYAGEGFL